MAYNVQQPNQSSTSAFEFHFQLYPSEIYLSFGPKEDGGSLLWTHKGSALKETQTGNGNWGKKKKLLFLSVAYNVECQVVVGFEINASSSIIPQQYSVDVVI